MPYLRRLIAIFQIYGGIAGGFATLNGIMSAQLVGVNAIIGFAALLLYVLAVIAGVMLLECKEWGRQLSRIIQGCAIPMFSLGFLQYQWICGAVYSVRWSANNDQWIDTGWAITSKWDAGFANDMPIYAGINIIAMISFIILGFTRITRYK